MLLIQLKFFFFSKDSLNEDKLVWGGNSNDRGIGVNDRVQSLTLLNFPRYR